MVTSAKTTTRFASGLRKPTRRRALGPQSGQSLIEIALLLPVLLTLLLGAIDLGGYAYTSIVVGNAAQAGAVYGAQGLVFAADTTGIQNAAANDYANNGRNPNALTIGSAISCGCDNGGAITNWNCSTRTNPSAGTCATGHWVVMVSVTTSGTYNAFFNYPGLPTVLTISRTSAMRVSQ